jgi:hypothetical protein
MIIFLQIGLVQTIAKAPLKPVPQTMEVTGSESPMVNWAAKNNRARQDISRSRLRALESSLEKGQVWIPPTPSHRKTWEEEVRGFLCNTLTTCCKIDLDMSVGYIPSLN